MTDQKSLHIALSSDHAAFAMKSELVEWLTEEGHRISDLAPQ